MSGKLDTRVLDQLLASAADRVDEAVRATAFDVQVQAQAKIEQFNAVDTGALRNSIYTVTNKSSSFSDASGAAAQKNPGAEVHDQTPGQPDKGTAYVAPAVGYAWFVEMGHHKLAARPFLQQAMDMAETFLKKYLPKELIP